MSTRDCERVIAARRCYIRKPGPRSEEPLTGEEWRALLDRCVRAGREDILEVIRIIVHGRAGVAPSAEARNALVEFVEAGRRRWQALIDPLPQDDPARMRLGYREFGFEVLNVAAAPTLIELRRRIDAASEVRLTGWHPFLSLDREPFLPRPIDGMVEAWLGAPEEGRARHDAATCDFWRASRTGKFMMIRGYSGDAVERVQPGTAIDVTNPIWRIGEVLLFASRVARQFGENPSIVARCRCTGLHGRTLVSIDWRRNIRGDRRCADEEVTLETEATAAEINDNLAEVLHPFLAPLYERLSFFELPMDLVVEEVAALRRGRF